MSRKRTATSTEIRRPNAVRPAWDFPFANAAARTNVAPMPIDADAIAEAERAGFDLSLVDSSLALTHEQRAEQHDSALALVLEFDRIRRERDAHFESAHPAPR